MLIGVASDLHLDFHNPPKEFFDWRGDVLLLAGDLAEKHVLLNHSHDFFDKVSKMAPRVFIVLGNHEHYGYHIDRTHNRLKKYLVDKWDNIHVLENESVQLSEGLRLFGSTFWTDFWQDPLAMHNCHGGMRDYYSIRVADEGFRMLKPSDIVTINANSFRILKDTLEEYPCDKFIVMTHHSLCESSISPRFKGDYLNPSFVNRLDNFIFDNPQIKVAVHGHTHDFLNYTINETAIICNPFGYPRERPTGLPPYTPAEFVI